MVMGQSAGPAGREMQLPARAEAGEVFIDGDVVKFEPVACCRCSGYLRHQRGGRVIGGVRGSADIHGRFRSEREG